MEKFNEKIEAFRLMVETHTIDSLQQSGLDCIPNLAHCHARIVPGRKYTKVDVGGSGRFMVVNTTGEIFGIKAYGVIHRGHFYGTLDTFQDKKWGR